jgi:hypothetical protein
MTSAIHVGNFIQCRDPWTDLMTHGKISCIYGNCMTVSFINGGKFTARISNFEPITILPMVD